MGNGITLEELQEMQRRLRSGTLRPTGVLPGRPGPVDKIYPPLPAGLSRGGPQGLPPRDPATMPITEAELRFMQERLLPQAPVAPSVGPPADPDPVVERAKATARAEETPESPPPTLDLPPLDETDMQFDVPDIKKPEKLSTDIDNRLAELEALKSIGTGLERMGNVRSAAELRMGQRAGKYTPSAAFEGLDKQIELEREKERVPFDLRKQLLSGRIKNILSGELSDVELAAEIKRLPVELQKQFQSGKLANILAAERSERDMQRDLRKKFLAETKMPGKEAEYDASSATSRMTRDMIQKAFNIEVPEGMNYNELAKQHPWLKNLQAQQFAFLATNADLKKEQIKAWALQKGKMRLEPAQVKTLIELNSSIDEMKAIIDEKRTKGWNTGPLMNAFEKTIGFFGTDQLFGKGEKMAFRAALTNVAAQYRRAISGANVSQYEIRLLKTFMPEASDQDSTFTFKARNYVRVLERIKKNNLQGFQAAGKDVSGFNILENEDTNRKFRIPKSELETARELGMPESMYEVY